MDTIAPAPRTMKSFFVESEDGDTYVGEVEIRNAPDGERWHAFITTDKGLVILSASNVRTIEQLEEGAGASSVTG